MNDICEFFTQGCLISVTKSNFGNFTLKFYCPRKPLVEIVDLLLIVRLARVMFPKIFLTNKLHVNNIWSLFKDSFAFLFKDMITDGTVRSSPKAR